MTDIKLLTMMSYNKVLEDGDKYNSSLSVIPPRICLIYSQMYLQSIFMWHYMCGVR